MRSFSRTLISALLAFATFFYGVSGELPIDLGLAEPYAILAGSTVTSTGVIGTVVIGNIGIFPGTAITGFPPAVLNGAIDSANGASGGAQGALTTAYNSAAGREFNTTLSNQDLAGMTLPPGVYKFDAAAAMNGALTLDANGNAAAVWIFQVGTALMIGQGSSVLFKDNIGNPDYVYWQVGSSADLAVGVSMVGNIMALQSIVVNDGAILHGRCLARIAAVTLDNSVITKPTTVSFSAKQTVSGISLTQYNAAPSVNSATLKEAIAESMTGVLPSNIKSFVITGGPTSAATIAALRVTARTLSTSSIILNYDVVVSSALTADVLQGQLNAAVNSGAFDTTLQAAALDNGATALQTATSDSIETITETNSNSAGSTSSNSDSDTLSAGAIAGIVIGASVGLLLIGMLAYFFLFHQPSAAANKSSAVEINEV